MKEFDNDLFKAKEQASSQPPKTKKGIGETVAAHFSERIFSKKEKKQKTDSLDDVGKIFLQQGCTKDQWNDKYHVMRRLFEIFGSDFDWDSFLSKEVIWEDKKIVEKAPIHHVELGFIEGMLFELSDFMAPEELIKFVNTLNKEDIVAFAKDLRAKGKPIIVERLEKKEATKFEIDEGAQFWKFSDTQSLNMDEYLQHCADKTESSGRLLVHVTKGGLFKMLLGNPKLISSVLIHLREDEQMKQVSEELDKRVGDYYEQTHSLSLGVHFSYDNRVVYPEGKYAVVFVSEALFNNYAFAQTSGDEDITIAGKSNDYFNDTSHEIDILKYGFFLVPERDKAIVDREFEKNPTSRKPRIFFYTGSLADGIQQLRTRIGTAEEKTKLRKKPLFQRGLNLNFSQGIDQNKSTNAQARFSEALQMVAEAQEKGESFYPGIGKFNYWHGSGNGQGVYFSV